MDLDAFVAVHSAQWSRLDDLSRRRRLTAEEADELVALYQRAATHLSTVRTAAPDAAVAARLSATVAWARAAITGGPEPFWRELARFAVVSFPAAVYRARWWAAGAALASTLVAVAVALWVARNPEVLAALGDRDDIRRYVENDFASYYSENDAGSFAARVWTNNAWVAAQCIALGISGVGVVYVLLVNAVGVGQAAGVMASFDRLGFFFSLITPHGLLELTCVFVAAGAGLRLFWAWVAPGPVPRLRALATEGRSMVSVALGLVFVLFVSGIVEAFVTPAPLPTWARVSIGAAVWLAFLGYAGVLGRRAARSGETGDVAADLREDVRPVAG